MNNKQLKIRNSTAEFLIFTKQNETNAIDVMVVDENVWLTQDMIAVLYDKARTTIVEHIKEIYLSGELDEGATCRNFRQVQKEGNRNVERERPYYNLEAIIAVGYRVNSERAIVFRRWATSILKEFALKGYVLDKKRLENGAYLTEEYFDNLLEQIREIRLSERKFYQKITDIYATALDYDKTSEMTILFYKTVQNKLHYAIHGHTAAEIIVERANADKEFMGLTNWEQSPDGKILKRDVSIAKNYLTEQELDVLNRITEMYLNYAELQIREHIPMTMADWKKALDEFLKFNRKDILNNAETITADIAKSFAETEFEKYRVVQDKLFESDFDKLLKQIEDEDGKSLNIIC